MDVNELAALRERILEDLDDGDWAGDVAEERGVTMAAVLALFMKPDKVALCLKCGACGFEGGEKCRHCRGLGYIGVGVAA